MQERLAVKVKFIDKNVSYIYHKLCSLKFISQLPMIGSAYRCCSIGSEAHSFCQQRGLAMGKSNIPECAVTLTTNTAKNSRDE